MIEALAVMALGALVLGAALGFAAVKFKVKGDPLVEKIDAILPQTQCGQCGYPGCKPYAEAIAKGESDINCCPPGGEEGIRKLADLLGREFKELSGEHGIEKPKSVAIIDEQTCIGCTLCIQACPVDAIVGAAKQMHTVIADQCTGCELCLPPCPVDCILMVPLPETLDNWKWKYPVIEIKPLAKPAAIPATTADHV
ncbi:MAG: electron transport complex subunit RsxB [Gammaproteobacteria bacterium]|nr:electron transport complex subunit RsxB [Rhodocyclaceae bacterium]MBU3909835.1 electron transport complex subunit RsxB [Gammaproteobacteria bacterium]MBU3988099.1 electron transport complex subunit RsxB [Gammaproteobacteria bacterium]MBU4003586.1 electron transport complex subunit RsxB [Gammaproteobacteria bacterium]MBU4020055.1 electron transport complex subunit RsxB [Gammaproteobacteria bacterium]